MLISRREGNPESFAFEHKMLKSLKAECFYSLWIDAQILTYPLLLAIAAVRGIWKCLRSWGPQKSIKGEVALITGSGRGLGRLIAIELAKRGCHVAIVDVQGKLAEETSKYIAHMYKVKAKAYAIDVSNYDELKQLRTLISNDLGDVTILINNAAILTLSSLDNPPIAEVQRMINVNFCATVYTLELFLPQMKLLNRGHIVNISSIISMLPSNLCPIYGATKAAVRHLTSSLRIELMQQNCNITATTMMPTFLNTNEQVLKIQQHADSAQLLPPIDGSIVVDYLIRGMLNGEDEVTVPGACLIAGKLLEMLPAYIREKMVALFSRQIIAKSRSDVVSDLLKQKDTQI